MCVVHDVPRIILERHQDFDVRGLCMEFPDRLPSVYQKTKLLWEEEAEDSLRIRKGFASLLEDSRTKPMFIMWVSEGFE